MPLRYVPSGLILEYDNESQESLRRTTVFYITTGKPGRKIAVNGLVALFPYNKPAAIQSGGGSTDFGWLDAVSPILPSAVSGTTSYEIGIWDAVKKEYLWFSDGELSFSGVEIKKNTKAEVSIADLPDGKTLTTGILTVKGKYVFGVRAVISDGDSVIAKSATLKVNVTVK